MHGETTTLQFEFPNQFGRDVLSIRRAAAISKQKQVTAIAQSRRQAMADLHHKPDNRSVFEQGLLDGDTLLDALAGQEFKIEMGD